MLSRRSRGVGCGRKGIDESQETGRGKYKRGAIIWKEYPSTDDFEPRVAEATAAAAAAVRTTDSE
jgi:hypothetical protein